MENSILQGSIKDNSLGRTCKIRQVFLICAFLFMLIIGRSLNNIFFYLFMIISPVIFIASKVEYCISYLLFLAPFASILKLNINYISFYSIIFFILVIKMIIVYQNIEKNFLFFSLLFFLYCILFTGFNQIATIITMFFGILLLYYVKKEKICTTTMISAYILGICLSSFLALLASFSDFLPNLSKFIDNVTIKISGRLVIRFCGLGGNPNYYSLTIILALSAIVILMNNNGFKLYYAILFVILSIFGFLTLSKSFLLSYLLLIVLSFFLLIKNRKKQKFIMLIAAIFGICLIYYFTSDYINDILFRFESADTLDKVSTGRLSIWKTYIIEIFNNLKTMFLGNGLNSIISSIALGSHNTYIQSIFYLGFIGTTIFLISLHFCIGKISFKNGLWLYIIILMFRMFAIGIFTDDNLWIYLLVFIILYQLVSTETSVNSNDMK